jgi:ADP-ribose pyrophosphatase YjhB (NUDIX family)
MENLRRAVFMVYTRPDGRIPAIKRNNPPFGIGLVGGRVEINETDLEALCRDAKEEAGITILATKKVFEMASTNNKFWGGNAFSVASFEVLFEGEFVSSSEGEIIWATPQELMNGAFPEYNTKLFQAMGCSL